MKHRNHELMAGSRRILVPHSPGKIAFIAASVLAHSLTTRKSALSVTQFDIFDAATLSVRSKLFAVFCHTGAPMLCSPWQGGELLAFFLHFLLLIIILVW